MEFDLLYKFPRKIFLMQEGGFRFIILFITILYAAAITDALCANCIFKESLKAPIHECIAITSFKKIRVCVTVTKDPILRRATIGVPAIPAVTKSTSSNRPASLWEVPYHFKSNLMLMEI